MTTEADAVERVAGADAGTSGAAAGAAAKQAGAGAGTLTGWEGSFKQATDIGSEEANAIIQSLVSKDAVGYSGTVAALVGQNAVNHNQQMLQLSTQALQNAVETSNMVGKQAVRHGDLAIDRQWNMDEVAQMAAITATVVAKVLAEMGISTQGK